MLDDVRVCFAGDSFVAGVGDPHALGWAGRLTATAIRAGVPLTAYNLGVRRETTPMIAARLIAECGPRLPADVAAGVVLSCGVNDGTRENGTVRVAVPTATAAMRELLAAVHARGWRALVVGPPPVDDDAHNERSAALEQSFATVCAAAGVSFLPVHHALRSNEVWMREVRAGDGAHPGAAGYTELAALVEPTWGAWLDGFADGAAAGRHVPR
ncbi:Lysophospholipase L1 [Nocardia farcinica]|uniref:GDSL-like Lipase/Acylhydrolase n=1 Tax=Nocardia farcinica TaxID=37329 RepID=A0A0H5P0H1_NOCFR|nr:GDSL-type esterase/lipase family protein [Nocardia farcinica]AXK87196.1 G-D-S-L family lipolytic protein [Nocardia farcinica]CRY81177.1 GDSL-like Lipase/Acylhydrolase [Nocardia farcinica]SIT11627.1 Lysophospholipase L1 [Nocardia farcinica]